MRDRTRALCPGAPAEPTRCGRPAARRGIVGRVLVSAALALGGGALAGAQEDFLQRPRAFQLYDSLAARAIADSARDHIVAARWPEALVDLQRLLEDHRGEVLGAARPTAEGARNPSQGDVHLGASHWAEQQLFALPRPAQTLYRERHGARAAEALARALELGDRGALAGVARRWPLTDAGLRAWWALGDLELERGETDDGLEAWARGVALALGEPTRAIADTDAWRAARELLLARVERGVGGGAGIGASPELARAGLARVEFALGLLAARAAAEAGQQAAASFLDGPGDGALIDPAGFGTEGWANAWRTPRELGSNPFLEEGDGLMRIFGARDAAAVYVSTGRAVHAIGAFSGESLWSFAARELGWDRVPREAPRTYRSSADTSLAEYAKALDTTDHIVAPAVARGIVVAALQVPIAYEKRDQFNRIEIIDVIPERRLVGLDARTGARLWDTLPPADWDGDSGSQAVRMTVVGPPTIVGTRVLAPLARQRGRIELHLGCFELGSGTLLWSTPIVTGQVPLNMFGRQVREFSAPPVAVRGATVVVQSNLGVVAAVDLFTGDTRWESVYEQIPIQAPTYYEAGSLRSRWRNAPPVIVGGTAIATPLDSPDLVAFDLATGALRWSYGHAALLQKRGSPMIATELLLGADARRVYLLAEGHRVIAFGAPDGLERSAPTRIDWQSDTRNQTAWRTVDFAAPALDDRYVYLPGGKSLTVIERDRGRIVREIPGDLGSGNLLVSNGAVVAVSAENVTAAFEWRGMVARAEAAVRAAPDDPRPAAELARLYLVRADTLADQGERSEAIALYDRALAAISAAGGADAEALPRALREPRYRAHLGQARLARRALDHAAAERDLQLALAAAPDGPRRREALLYLQDVQRRRAARAGGEPLAYEGTLRALAEVFGTTPLVVHFEPALGWTLGGAEGGPEDPWIGALVPEELRTGASGGRSRADEGDAPGVSARTTVGVWAGLTLIGEDQRRGDTAAEVGRLFTLVREHGTAPLPGGSGAPVRAWAAFQLDRLRRASGAELFAPYEAAARALLDDALRAPQDGASLARIAELYPGTDAARRADDLRLDLAVSAGEVEEVARIVLDPLPPDSALRTLDERELRLVLRLAAAFGARGNLALRAALGESLAALRPNLVVDLEPHRGQPITAVAEGWRRAERDAAQRAAELPATANHLVVPTDRIEGDFAYVGAAQAEDGRSLALFLSEAGLIALAPGERNGFVWNTPLVSDLGWQERAERTFIEQGLVHVASRDRITCVRGSDGRGGWTWYVGEGRVILRAVPADGVLLVRTAPEFSDGTELLVALDAAAGVELWRRATPRGTVPVAGDGRLVLVLDSSPRAEVIDLFLGGRIRTLDVGDRRDLTGAEGWISAGNYVVPQFLREEEPTKNHIVAFDLESGAQAWRVDLESHRGTPHLLLTVLEHAEPDGSVRRLCVLRRAGGDSTSRTVHVLNERLGALDRGALVELRSRAHLVDLPPNGVVRLSSPLFFVATPPTSGAAGERTTLRAVDVRLGTLWETPLPRASEVSSSIRMLAPAVTQSAVIVASAAPRGVGRIEWELTFFDRQSGELRESRVLPREREHLRWQGSVAVGGALFLTGLDRLDRFE